MTSIQTTHSQPYPRQRPYSALGAAAAMWRCKDKEVLIEGPAGTGKTRGVLEKVHFCLLKYPGARALAVRKTRASMTESVLVTYEEKVLPAGSPIKAGIKRKTRQSYEYPNGSSLVIGGMDNAERIMSTEFDIIVGFEWTEADEDDHEKLTTRLRNGVMPYQQIIVDCNPSFPNHWLNLRANKGIMTRFLSRHEDNPTVTEEYLATLENLSGARYLRLRKGVWAAQDGLVYPDFDPAIHVLDRYTDDHKFIIQPSWLRYRVIDFGFTNPFVCQWWAVDPDGRIYLYREIYMSQRQLRDHATTILQYPEPITATIADPEDAEARATLATLGIPTIAADKAINLGIQDVTARLKPAGDGKPRLFILKNTVVELDTPLYNRKKPTSTLAEIDNYRWPKAGKDKNDKEVPIDEDNHGMDGMRYLVRYLDAGRSQGVF